MWSLLNILSGKGGYISNLTWKSPKSKTQKLLKMWKSLHVNIKDNI